MCDLYILFLCCINSLSQAITDPYISCFSLNANEPNLKTSASIDHLELVVNFEMDSINNFYKNKIYHLTLKRQTL